MKGTSTLQSLISLSCPHVKIFVSSGDQDKKETQSECSLRTCTEFFV